MLRRQLNSIVLATSRVCRRRQRVTSGPPDVLYVLYPSNSERYHACLTAAEEAQDKTLEDEQFASLQSNEDDDYLPWRHRLARKADALDAELHRLRWVLYERRQVVMDTKPATWCNRAAQADVVVRRGGKHKLQLAVTHAPRTQAEKEAGDPTTVVCNADHLVGVKHTGTPAQNHPSQKWAVGSNPRVVPLTVNDVAAYTHWTGSSVFFVRLYGVLRGYLQRAQAPSAADDGGPSTGLSTLSEDMDYIRRIQSLHQLNYYSRMNLTPTRHAGHALYQALWNTWVSMQNAMGCMVFGSLREIRDRGLLCGFPIGFAKSLKNAFTFLCYGFAVSPAIHLYGAVTNSVYGVLNASTGRYYFEAMSGRWMRSTVADAEALHDALDREKRLLRAIGRREFVRKRLLAESKWVKHMAMMGFSLDKLRSHVENGGGAATNGPMGPTHMDPYEVLGVRRSATQPQIKARYKKLVMVLHPDTQMSASGGTLSEAEQHQAQERFTQIASAYQILSNVEKRRAFDLGGCRGVRAYEEKFGQFLARTPDQIVQGLFGGRGFQPLLGDLLRSHWALRYEAQVSVSVHDLDALQCIRTRQMAAWISRMADIHALRPTTPSHGKNNTAGAPAAAASFAPKTQRVPTHRTRIPNPFQTASATLCDSTSSQNRTTTRGRSSRIDADLRKSIREELGEKSEQPRTQGDETQGIRSPGDSPYVLRPGSCEDNCFSKEFDDRCDAFVKRMSEACFGPELLCEVGESYVVNAQRYLGILPFYAPKMLVYRKIFTGVGRLHAAFKEQVRSMTKEELGRRVMVEYFNMEYDNVVGDAHVALRYALQLVLNDVSVPEEVRRRRCYAVWLLGEKMMAKGTPWNMGVRDDAELQSYILQAATSAASTSRPPVF